MNLVEATIEGDEVAFGQLPRVALDPARRRARARPRRPRHPARELRGRGVRAAGAAHRGAVTVVEELGSDAHVFFPVDAPRVGAELLEGPSRTTRCSPRSARCSRRASTRAPRRAGGRALGSPVDPSRFHFFDPQTGESCSSRRHADAEAAADSAERPRDGRRPRDEAERDAGPGPRPDRAARGGRRDPLRAAAEADLGVSRLTVRAALDDLVREGYLVRRRGSGTFVSEPKIAQELTLTSFTEDMERRGLTPRAGRSS